MAIFSNPDLKYYTCIGSTTFALATNAPMKYMHAKPNVKSIYKQNPYPNPNIKLNLKPYLTLTLTLITWRNYDWGYSRWSKCCITHV